MNTPKVFSYLFFCCVLFFSSFSAFAEWTIKKFEVVVHTDFNDSNPVTNISQTEIEEYLEEVAIQYSRMGFVPPLLEQNDAKDAYLIHIVNRSGRADYSAPCMAIVNGSKVFTDGGNITFSKSWLIDNNKIKNKGYQDLAHELFHAVQYSYDLFYKNCALGDWIVEGTAESIGLDMATKLRGIPIETCQIGARPYDEKLYIQDEAGKKPKRRGRGRCSNTQAYLTKSIWRYLGEEDYFKNIRYSKANSKPFTKSPKYEYLVEFFKTNIEKASEAEEYIWLHDRLNKYFGYGLDRMYPKFAGVIAGYYPDRLEEVEGVNVSEKPDKWFNFLFGGCEVVLVSKSKPTEFQSNPIEPVASQCLEFDFDFTGQANFTITAEGTGKSLLGLAISPPGSVKRQQPLVYPSTDAPTKVSFKFSEAVEADKPKYYIVSNVANEPHKTKQQSPKFTVTFNTATANLREATTKSPTELEDEQLEQTDSGIKLAKAQIEQGLETDSWYVGANRTDADACEDAFKRRVCGPRTNISIGLVPDSSLILLEAVQPNMSFERLTDVMGGLDEHGLEKLPDEYRKISEAQSSKDGSWIGITIPLIEYGFTGSFDKALISVSKAQDDIGGSTSIYKSIGPQWAGDCHDGYFPFSGKVTIDEATHQVIRGSYSANLVDTKDITNCESAPVSKQISGTFSLPNPRIGKDEPEGVLSEDIVDHTIQQINEIMPGMYTGELGEKAREVAAQKLREKEARKAARQQESETASTDLVCECKCETATDMLDNNPDCFRQCLPTYQSCEDIDQIVSQSEYNRPPTEQENEQIAKLRTEFEVLIQKQFPTQQMQQMMLIGFDDLPNLKAKQQLVDQFKGKQ